MSKRHRWWRGRYFRGVVSWGCECGMRRRMKAGRRCARGFMQYSRWEYLPANSVSGWLYAQRTCGPCPGKGGA